MDIYELIKKRRSIRRFDQKPIKREKLLRLIDAARVAPSSANIQSIKYVIVSSTKLVTEVFKYTKWAGYLKGAGTPINEEKPTAFIIILTDTKISKNHLLNDIGAASMSIQLAAIEEGLGTCWIGSIDKEKIKEVCKIEDKYIIPNILALGYPKEEPMIEEINNNDIKYYKDDKNVLHVPKRTLDEIILKEI